MNFVKGVYQRRKEIETRALKCTDAQCAATSVRKFADRCGGLLAHFQDPRCVRVEEFTQGGQLVIVPLRSIKKYGADFFLQPPHRNAHRRCCAADALGGPTDISFFYDCGEHFQLLEFHKPSPSSFESADTLRPKIKGSSSFGFR